MKQPVGRVRLNYICDRSQEDVLECLVHLFSFLKSSCNLNAVKSALLCTVLPVKLCDSKVCGPGDTSRLLVSRPPSLGQSRAPGTFPGGDSRTHLDGTPCPVELLAISRSFLRVRSVFGARQNFGEKRASPTRRRLRESLPTPAPARISQALGPPPTPIASDSFRSWAFLLDLSAAPARGTTLGASHGCSSRIPRLRKVEPLSQDS